MAAYEYDGLFRRTVKAVSNSGAGIVAFSDDLDMNGTADADGIQAGNRSEHYFYAGWQLVETRDGSDNTLGQLGIHSRGRLCHMIDEPIAYDRNTDVTFGGSADDDCLDASGSQRYTYHQDANWRVVALTDESGAVVERYDYTAYGEPTVFVGVPGAAGGSGTGGETGGALLVSSVGNPLMHQGLFRDDETGTYQNRFRQLHSRSGRFMQRDASEKNAAYEYLANAPDDHIDPHGLTLFDDDPALATRQSKQPSSTPKIAPMKGPYRANAPTSAPRTDELIRGSGPFSSEDVIPNPFEPPRKPNDTTLPTNGCSAPAWVGGSFPGGFDFTAACNAHDQCYGTKGKSKAECDQEFLRDLFSICQHRYALNKECLRWAQNYHDAVVLFAGDAYQSAQPAQRCSTRVPNIPPTRNIPKE